MQKDPLTAVAAAAVGVVAAARATRLVTKDHWPPMSFVRRKYVELTEGTEWSVLAECPFCVAPYVVAADLAWALRSDLSRKWWIANGWFAASYAASLIVVRDDVPDRTINVKAQPADNEAASHQGLNGAAAPAGGGLPAQTVGALA
jgi:hypothetical protein